MLKRGAIAGTSAISIAGLYYYASDTRAAIHKAVTIPLLHLLDAETAHETAVWALGQRLGPRDTRPDDPALHMRLFGRDLTNPGEYLLSLCSRTGRWVRQERCSRRRSVWPGIRIG